MSSPLKWDSSWLLTYQQAEIDHDCKTLGDLHNGLQMGEHLGGQVVANFFTLGIGLQGVMDQDKDRLDPCSRNLQGPFCTQLPSSQIQIVQLGLENPCSLSGTLGTVPRPHPSLQRKSPVRSGPL